MFIGAAYGESCTANEDCTEANNKCDTSATTNCICADNYFRKDDNTCASSKSNLVFMNIMTNNKTLEVVFKVNLKRYNFAMWLEITIPLLK